MSKALVIYADGTEDLEVTAVADILTRGGVQIFRAALTDAQYPVVRLAHGTRVYCDCRIADCFKVHFDAIVIPGGLPGAQHCHDNADLAAMLKVHHERGDLVAAICAAPGYVLAPHGILDGNVAATCYPGCKDDLIANLKSDGVVFDEKARVITGKGPGFAIPFALRILEALEGADKAHAVARGMLVE